MPESPQTFEQWALVEIYGHQKYAGLVTEQTIGGCNFVRVDVPDTPRTKAFTKLFGQGAIFSITPIQEDVARSLAASYDQTPVNVYELPAEVQSAIREARQKRLATVPAGASSEQSPDDDDDHDFDADGIEDEDEDDQ